MLLNKLFHRPVAVRPAAAHPAAEAKPDWQYADNAIPVPEVREDDPDSTWALWDQAASQWDALTADTQH